MVAKKSEYKHNNDDEYKRLLTQTVASRLAEAAAGEVNVTQADDEVVHLWRGSEGRRKASAADTGIGAAPMTEASKATAQSRESSRFIIRYILSVCRQQEMPTVLYIL